MLLLNYLENVMKVAVFQMYGRQLKSPLCIKKVRNVKPKTTVQSVLLVFYVKFLKKLLEITFLSILSPWFTHHNSIVLKKLMNY